MTAIRNVLVFLCALVFTQSRAQEDFIRMMMLSQLLGGGGFGGGGGGGAGNQFNSPQHTAVSTGFEGDPRSLGGSGASGSNPGGLFGGLMGLLSRNAGGSAPLLLDVDGDILRQHLLNRAGLGNNGAGGTAAEAAASAPIPSSVSNVNHREAGAVPSGNTGGRPRSMPLDVEPSITGMIPAHAEGSASSSASGASAATNNSP